MAIILDTMQQVGATLNRKAAREQRPVDDRFLVELYAYAHHPILNNIDEGDARAVVETIGKEALAEHGSEVGKSRGTLWEIHPIHKNRSLSEQHVR